MYFPFFLSNWVLILGLRNFGSSSLRPLPVSNCERYLPASRFFDHPMMLGLLADSLRQKEFTPWKTEESMRVPHSAVGCQTVLRVASSALKIRLKWPCGVIRVTNSHKIPINWCSNLPLCRQIHHFSKYLSIQAVPESKRRSRSIN